MNTLQQQLPKRFTDAVSKLYNAFHENRLNALDCKACAVGNILSNKNEWQDVFCAGVIKPFPTSNGISLIRDSGYSIKELFEVEHIFVFGMMSHENKDSPRWAAWGLNDINNKEYQFKGLCAVIEYLCELDNIPNIMDFTSLFETENDKPVKELQFV